MAVVRINTGGTRPAADATDISRGIFGANAGLDRVLKLLKKYGITATFFVPAHTAESFPDSIVKIRDGGHEM